MTTAVSGQGHTASTTLQRPNDLTAYAAGDVIADATSGATVLTFQGAQGSSGTVSMILNEVLVVDSANQSPKPDLELWLFSVQPAAQQDNTAFAPTDAELNNLVAIVQIPSSSFIVGNAAAGASGNAVSSIKNIGTPINLAINDPRLFAFLVVRNAYTPVPQEQFVIDLKLLD
jgi:hypothetical protein